MDPHRFLAGRGGRHPVALASYKGSLEPGHLLSGGTLYTPFDSQYSEHSQGPTQKCLDTEVAGDSSALLCPDNCHRFYRCNLVLP